MPARKPAAKPPSKKAGHLKLVPKKPPAPKVAKVGLPTQLTAIQDRYEPLRIDPRSGDPRRLGVPLRGMTVRDGDGFARTVALDDPRLGAGLSFVQGRPGDLWRWTDGAAAIPATLWAGAVGDVTLDVTLVPAAGWARSGVYSVRDGATPALAA